MARLDYLNMLYSNHKSPLEFDFDSLIISPLDFYVTGYDVDHLTNIATSIRYASSIEKKYKEINETMKRNGFIKFHAGTNRVVYTHSEDQRIVAKIAVDKVGMRDNPNEFNNQIFLKPFVTKMFYTSYSGVIGMAERVQPILSPEEFSIIGGDVFDLLNNFMIGKYILEDIGSSFFMNWGLRNGFGPCLLDYPYLFELDGNKLECKNMVDGPCGPEICKGEIDYDIGFNNLICNKCGKLYLATELKKEQVINNKVIRGGDIMKTEIIIGGKVICSTNTETEYVKPKEKLPKPDKSYITSIIVIEDKVVSHTINTSSKMDEDFNVLPVSSIELPIYNTVAERATIIEALTLKELQVPEDKPEEGDIICEVEIEVEPKVTDLPIEVESKVTDLPIEVESKATDLPEVESSIDIEPNNIDYIREKLFDISETFMNDIIDGRIKLFRINKSELKKHIEERIKKMIVDGVNPEDYSDEIILRFIDKYYDVIISEEFIDEQKIINEEAKVEEVKTSTGLDF